MFECDADASTTVDCKWLTRTNNYYAIKILRKTTNKSNIHDKLKGRKDNLDLINNRRGGEIDNENNSNLIQNNEERLRDSYKINVSIHDNSLRNDAFLSIPRNDEPFPDMDELSTESPLLRRSSLISD